MTKKCVEMHCQPKTLDPRPCDGCRKIFTPERSWQRFHSEACRNKWHQDPKCPTCGRAEPRSTEANKRLWALYQLIADNVKPAGKEFSRETWHYYFKGLFLGCTDIPLPNGRIRTEPNSTRELDKRAFNDYMAQVEAWAAERNVYLEE
jgi:hypothetical protein